MFLEDMGGAVAAADAEDHTLVPVMNGLTFAGGGQGADRFVISKRESGTIEPA